MDVPGGAGSVLLIVANELVGDIRGVSELPAAPIPGGLP